MLSSQWRNATHLSALQPTPTPLWPAAELLHAPRPIASGRQRSSQHGSAARSLFRFPSSAGAAELSPRNAVAMLRSCFLRFAPEDRCDYLRHALPVGGFRLQVFFAGRRQPVIPGPAVVLRFAPIARDQPAVLQSV